MKQAAQESRAAELETRTQAAESWQMPSVEAGPSEVSGSQTNQRGPPKEKGVRTSGLVMAPRARRPALVDKKALTGDDALGARVHAIWWTLAAIAGMHQRSGA